MPAVLTKITPGRGRPLDTVDLEGAGFSPTLNAVTFDGVPAAVLVNSEALVRVTVPGALGGTNRHATVVLTNLDDTSETTWYWWAKPTVAAVSALELPVKAPGVGEQARGLGRLIKNMNVAEARFFERLATKAELLGDLLAAKGDFFSKAAAPLGVRQALAGLAGQVFVSGSDTIGGQFQNRQCQTSHWGGVLTGTDLTAFLVAGGQDSSDPAVTNPTTKDVVVNDGQIALVSVRERSSVSSRVNRVEILVDDVVVLDVQNGSDEFPGPGIRNGESVTFYPGIRVTRGQRVQIRLSRNNTTTDCQALAYALVV